MAKSYAFNYTRHPELYKNPEVENRKAGNAFSLTVYEVLEEYGFRFGPDGKTIWKDPIRGCKFRSYGWREDMLHQIAVSLTDDNKLVVDFEADPLFPHNSNDEIIEDIRQLCVERNIIDAGEQPYVFAIAKSGGCYVATAVYGSYDCPQVWTLRRYRDYGLARTWYGRVFIRAYYAISPILVQWFGEAEWFKKLWRGNLDRMVERLNDKGYKDSPYTDKNW